MPTPLSLLSRTLPAHHFPLVYTCLAHSRDAATCDVRSVHSLFFGDIGDIAALLATTHQQLLGRCINPRPHHVLRSSGRWCMSVHYVWCKLASMRPAERR